MSFADYLSQARQFSPDDNDGNNISTIYDGLETEYTDLLEGSQKSAEMQAERVKELESEVSRLKSQMFDKMMQTPVDNSNGNENEDEEDNTPKGIAGLFGK